MYTAIICRLKNVRKHPNADRLQLANVVGTQIVISLTEQEGDLGVFFDSDGCLTTKMLTENKLLKSQGGYFDENGRVRIQRFRGEKSNGIWLPISSLAWTGINLNSLHDGDEFEALNGQQICGKYVTRETRLQVKGPSKPKKSKFKIPLNRVLIEHFETNQLVRNLHKIPIGSICYWSEKQHGTSGRTGHLLVPQKISGFKLWWNKYCYWLGRYSFKSESKWIFLTGTRRVVLNTDQETKNGYYSGTTFRKQIHQSFVDKNIPKGITFYYEIVGYDDRGKSIMPKHKVPESEKTDRKLYGKEVTYSYGCNPGEWEVYIYRVTLTNSDGLVVDLPWPQVENLCAQYGLKTVKLLDVPFVYNGDSDKLLARAEELCNGQSTFDPKHPKEGVVLRVDGDKLTAFKHKSFLFKLMEFGQKEDETVVDIEEAESLASEEIEDLISS